MKNREPRAYILDWTMNDYSNLLESLKDNAFAYEREAAADNVIVNVPFPQLEQFSRLIQKHLNSPVNYVDIQYRERNTTVIIFQSDVFLIENAKRNEEVRKWAIEKGLPPEQADWGTSF